MKLTIKTLKQKLFNFWTSKKEVEVKIKRFRDTSRIPFYGTSGAAGFDFFADRFSEHPPVPPVVTLTPESPTRVLKTGLVMEIPEGYVMLLFSRSGQGFNQDLRLANCVGVIDSDYRGEVAIKLTWDPNSKSSQLEVDLGKAIAQGILLPFPKARFILGEELSETVRGTSGFGSTNNRV